MSKQAGSEAVLENDIFEHASALAELGYPVSSPSEVELVGDLVSATASLTEEPGIPKTGALSSIGFYWFDPIVLARGKSITIPLLGCIYLYRSFVLLFFPSGCA